MAELEEQRRKEEERIAELQRAAEIAEQEAKAKQVGEIWCADLRAQSILVRLLLKKSASLVPLKTFPPGTQTASTLLRRRLVRCSNLARL